MINDEMAFHKVIKKEIRKGSETEDGGDETEVGVVREKTKSRKVKAKKKRNKTLGRYGYKINSLQKI